MATPEEVIEEYYERLKSPGLGEEGFSELTDRIERLQAIAKKA